MKRMSMFLFAAVAANAILPARGGDSAPFLLDTADGTRIATEGEAIPIAYSPRWGNAASCTVDLGGSQFTATEEGSTTWTPQGTGGHTLTHTAGSTTYTAQFAVLGGEVVVHPGGSGSSGESGTSGIWTADKTHLITAPLTIPAGVSLTIEAGAVVKFMPGASLTVANGGNCTARGVIFTHVNDDTIGGDTLMDGDSAAPKMGDYTITGSVTDDDSTEYRYMPPQTLQSSISYDTRLRGYRTYIVSNFVTVASGATLTLQPGTILKFNTGCSLTVNGTLDAQGTRAAPIVFTSLKDDAHGGDTNGDGEKTLPDANDWRSIYVSGKASFSFAEILYGGGTSSSSDSGVLVGNSGGTISLANTTIAHAMYDGIFSRATVTGENMIIHDCDRGINTCGGSGVFKNCVIDRCRWGVMAEGGSGTYYNCIITRFYGSTSWPTGWGVAYWSGSLKTYNCCVYSTLSGASNYRSSPMTVNNIIADPLFEDADNMNFRIAANSPCVDAGDGTVAPELDYWGQPRMDVKAVADTGTHNSDGVCPDIGIYEVPGAAPVPLPDLAVVSVATSATLPLAPGDSLAVTYTVTNRGAAVVSGLVRDLFRFTGADAATAGLTVDAAEVEQAYNVPTGGCVTLSATITVPTLKVGKWKVEVGVNAGNYPYEQNLSNNRATSEDAISSDLEALGLGTRSVTVGKGEYAGFVLSGLPTAGGVVRVTGAGDAVSAYGGNGAMPTAGATSAPLPGGGCGATALPTVPLADGSLLIVFPARAAGESAYLVLENGGGAAATVSVEVKAAELALYDAAPGRIANVGEATVTITGSGLVDGGGHAGRVTLPTVTLGGRAAKFVEVLNHAQIAATFDVEGMAAGRYGVAVEAAAWGHAALPNAVEIYAAKTGPKLRAWLEMPSSVRDGRVFTGYVCYANEGDSPMTMPVFKVARQDSSTKMGLVASESMTETTLYVGGISPTHPAGVLKAGDEARIPFYFQPFGTYRIKLTHIKDAEDLAAYPTFGGTKAYLAAMSAAATRLNLRGRTAYNVHDFVDQALWEKNGVAHAAVSGYLVDAKTGEPIANASISLVGSGNSTNLPPATATTDEAGSFQLTNLADGEYRWFLDDGNTLADASTNTVTIAGQADLNGVTVSATPGGRISGYVLTATGEPVGYGKVALKDMTTEVELQVGETDGFGAFVFTGLRDGTYVVSIASKDGYVGVDVADVEISAAMRKNELVAELQCGGVIEGVVSYCGAPVTNGTVRAILENGAYCEVYVATNGLYKLEGLSPATYALEYCSGDFESARYDISIGAGNTEKCDIAAVQRIFFMATRTVGFDSLETQFIVDESIASNTVSYAWDFDGDGIVDSAEASPKWKYTSISTNSVSLSVTDTAGFVKTCTAEGYVRVDKALETLYQPNAVVMGVNSKTLECKSLSDGSMELSGTASIPLVPGVVVMGQYDGDWYVRKIVSVSGDASSWSVTTEQGKLTDVYKQLTVAFSSPLVDDSRGAALQSARLQSSGSRLLAVEKKKTWDAGPVEIYAATGIKPDLKTTKSVYVDYAETIKDGKECISYAVVGSIQTTLSIEAYGKVGANWSKTYEIPTKIAVPLATPIPVTISPDFSVRLSANLEGKLSGEAHASIGAQLRVGGEMVDGKWTWYKPVKFTKDAGASWDLEGSGTFGVTFSPGIKARVCGISSLVLAPEFTTEFCYTGRVRSPPTFEVKFKTGLRAEVNLLDLGKLGKIGVSPTIGISENSLFKWTGPEPDFDYSPKSCQYAPATYNFVNKSRGDKIELPYFKRTYQPKSYRWDLGIMSSTAVNPTVTYTQKGKYDVYLKAMGYFITGPYRKKMTIQVGEKDDDDGEEDPDDDKSDTGKKSWDPNEVAGPLGVGEARYVKPGDWMDYTIYFENKEGFDIADAQEVKVTNPLSEWLDWSTFEMREVAFNNQNDNSLDGLANGTRDIKMNGTNKYVRATVQCDAGNGVVEWYLRVYDPNGAFGWPNDGSGFLPSNDATHRGEGHLTYRVKVRDDAPANVKIVNSATIVFDYNDPIETEPNWTNTVAQVASVKVNSDVEGDVTDLDLIVGMPYGELPTPKARAGYAFGGWYTGPNGTGRRVRAQDPVQAGDSGLYAYWLAHAYTVHFEPNGGTGAMSDQSFEFDKEDELDANAFSFEGHSFAGWATNETGAAVFADCAVVTNLTDAVDGLVNLYATWTANTYTVTFDANGGAGGWSSNMVYGAAIAAPAVTREGYTFAGWQPAPLETVPANDVTFTAQWEISEIVKPDPGPEPDPEPVAEETPRLWTEVTGAAPAAASTYEGYLYDAGGNVKGTIQVKVGKPNKKTGLAAVKATVIGTDGKKKTLKAAEKGKAQIAGDGPTTIPLAGGDACEVILGAKGMGGTYGAHVIDGSLNVFASKDAADKSVAAGVLGKWKGAVNVAWRRVEDNAPYQTLSVAIAAKGKAKVAGTLADGTKVSAKGQLIVGEEWCCVPVVAAKKAKLAFAVWLPVDDKAAGTAAPHGAPAPVVVGLDDAIAGKPRALKAGAAFRLGGEMGDATYGAYLPNGIAVTGGAKWTLPKAGKVQLAKDGTVDAAKLGENPSALKLTYKAKDGTFKGSFKAYADVGGKPKGTTVKVTGVLVDGVGYGAATVKGSGGVAVTVE